MVWTHLPSNGETLRDLIACDGGGMADVTMAALREAQYAGRLGCNVLSGIGTWLNDAGIGWLPEQLPNDQDHVVTLYVRSSRAGTQVELARHLASLEARKASETAI